MTQTKNTKSLFFLSTLILCSKSHDTKVLSPCILKPSHFLFLCVIMENICIFKVKGNHSNLLKNCGERKGPGQKVETFISSRKGFPKKEN